MTPGPTDLMTEALEARKKAYAPYSNFTVGAALLCDDGTVVPGVNVENGSYGLTLCAERSAVAAAVTRGLRDFRAIAVVADTAGPVRPCGACLQVLAEFSPDLTVHMGNLKGDVETVALTDLLTRPFQDPAP